MEKLVTPQDALTKIYDKTSDTTTEYIDVLNAIGRVAAENPISVRNLPPKNNSAMDGYAVKFEDITEVPATLAIKGVIQAGDNVEDFHIQRGEAFKIMTGAFVPKGADTVVEYEITSLDKNFVTINEKKKFGANIRKTGEDIKYGDEINITGKVINTEIQSRLISAGVVFLKVYAKPRIAVIGTGNELIFPEGSGNPFSTIDSNSFYVMSLLKTVGADVSYLGISKDDTENFVNAMKQTDKFDVVITSAGISSGDFDVVSNSSKKLGISWVFNGVKQKPGKPFSFGIMQNGNLLFSLPGNPVSSAFCAYYYILPALKKMCGYNHFQNPTVKGYLTKEFYKKNNRFHFNRGTLKYDAVENRFCVTPYLTQESHLISSLQESNCYIIVDANMIGKIEKDTLIECVIYDFNTIF